MRSLCCLSSSSEQRCGRGGGLRLAGGLRSYCSSAQGCCAEPIFHVRGGNVGRSSTAAAEPAGHSVCGPGDLSVVGVPALLAAAFWRPRQVCTLSTSTLGEACTPSLLCSRPASLCGSVLSHVTLPSSQLSSMMLASADEDCALQRGPILQVCHALP